jgi:hypothetical protein
MQKSPKNQGKTLQHICKGEDDNIFGFAKKNFGKLPMEFISSSFLCVNIFSVKANSGSDEAMKR